MSRTGRIVQRELRQAPIWGKNATNIDADNPSVSLRLTALLTRKPFAPSPASHLSPMQPNDRIVRFEALAERLGEIVD